MLWFNTDALSPICSDSPVRRLCGHKCQHWHCHFSFRFTVAMQTYSFTMRWQFHWGGGRRHSYAAWILYTAVLELNWNYSSWNMFFLLYNYLCVLIMNGGKVSRARITKHTFSHRCQLHWVFYSCSLLCIFNRTVIHGYIWSAMIWFGEGTGHKHLAWLM